MSKFSERLKACMEEKEAYHEISRTFEIPSLH